MIPPKSSKSKIPSFNEVMGNSQKPPIPSFEEVMGEKKNGGNDAILYSAPSTLPSAPPLGLPKDNVPRGTTLDLSGNKPSEYSLNKGFSVKPNLGQSQPQNEAVVGNKEATKSFGLTPIQDLQNQNVAKPDNTLSIPNVGVFNKQVNAFNEVTDKTITGNAPDESVVIRNEYNNKRKSILNPAVVIASSELTPENNFGLNTNLNTAQVSDNTNSKIAIKNIKGAPVNETTPPTPEQEFKQKVSDNLSSLEKETIAKSGEYAMKVTSDPVAAGFITKAILGDNMAISQKRQIDKGYSVPQSDLYQTGQVGITSMIAALDKKYESEPNNPEYISQRVDLQNQSKELIDKFPEYKVSQLTKAVAIELGKLHPEVRNTPAAARLYMPELKKEMGLSDEDIKAIDFDNYPTSNFITSTIAPIYKGALGLGLSATRAIGGALGVDKDLLNSRLTEASQSPTFFDDIETMQNTGQTIDVNKASPTFLQNIEDPNKGKYNYNFHTISNAIGNGVGQLAWFVYGTKGAGAIANKGVGALGAAIEPEVAGAMAAASKGETLTLSEINALNRVNQGVNGAVTVNGLPFKLSADATNEVGMAGLMMGQGYEDYYQKARTVISDKPEDEWKRHAFSLVNGALDYLGFRVLGNVVKGLPPAAEKEIGQVFKDAPNLASVNKAALQSKLTDFLKKAGEAGKETAFVGSATTASEIAKAVVVNVMGNDKAAEEENAQLPSVIEGSIMSLPFSMFLPILGSKIIAGGQSRVHKENIYNAGISPESYKGDAHKLFEMGAINQEQLNDRIQVINTADKVFKSIPSDVLDKLNHNQRVTYVNSKIRELAIKAKTNNVQDEALAEYYNNQIKDEVAKRTGVLNGGGKEGEFPESVSVVKPNENETSQQEGQIPVTSTEAGAPNEAVAGNSQKTEVTENEKKLLEPHTNSPVFMGLDSDVQKLRYIADQAQNISPDGTKIEVGDGNSAARKTFGDELVDAAIAKFPENDSEKAQSKPEPVSSPVISDKIVSNEDIGKLYRDTNGLMSPSDISEKFGLSGKAALDVFNKWVDNNGKPKFKIPEGKAIVEPPKPIPEMNSEELLNYSDKVKKALARHEKVFADKTEAEKEAAGLYDYVDNVSDLRDTAQRVNFVENSENLDDLASSTKSALRDFNKDNPSDESLAILNAAKKKAAEMDIAPETLIKEVIKKVGNDYKDKNDAEFMMRNYLEKLTPTEQQPSVNESSPVISDKGDIKNIGEVGFKWQAPEGEKEITGDVSLNGKRHFTISIDGKHSNELISEQSLAKDVERDISDVKGRDAMKPKIEEKRQKEKESQDAINDIKGFADDKNPMQKAKILNTLNTEQLFNGKLQSRKSYIEEAVKNGGKVVEENGKMRLYHKNGSSFMEGLTKTEYDYAKYLIDNPEKLKSSKPTNTEENNSESFKPFEDIVKNSNSVKEAFDKVKKLKGIPADVSEAFRNKYDSEKKLSPEKAFEKFYNEVKGESTNTEQNNSKSKADALIQEASGIADGIKKRKEKVTNIYQYDLKVSFAKEHGLKEEDITKPNFIKLWNGVLADSNGISLSDIAPDRIKDALANPDAYEDVYNKVYDKFGGKRNSIDDVESARKYILDNLPPKSTETAKIEENNSAKSAVPTKEEISKYSPEDRKAIAKAVLKGDARAIQQIADRNRGGSVKLDKSNIDEGIKESNAVFETRDGKPIGFNYDTDKVARERFDIPKLKQIGKGSGRTVFDLGNGRVLKVAHTARGLEQNIHEGDYYLKGIVPEVYERGLNYVVADNVPRIKANDIVPTYDVETGKQNGTARAGDMIRDLGKFSQKDFDNKTGEVQDAINKYGLGDVLSYDVLYNDFAAGRNWGYKDGMPVHIDGGTFGGVDMIDSYKGEKPLDNAEFRDIYNKSRALKKQFGDTDKNTKFDKNEIKTNEGNMPLEQYVSRAKAVLEKLFPKAKFEAYDTTADYLDAGGTYGSKGLSRIDKDGNRTIMLDLQEIRDSGTAKTAFHEVIHPIVDEVVGEHPEEINPLWNSLAAEMKDVKGFDKVLLHVMNYKAHEHPAAEGITELLTQISEGNISLNDVPPARKSAIVDLLNKIFEKLGLNIRFGDDYDFKSFATDIKKAFETGDTESLKKVVDKKVEENQKAKDNASKIAKLLFGDKADKSQSGLDDKIKTLRDLGFSEREISDVLKESGFADNGAGAPPVVPPEKTSTGSENLGDKGQRRFTKQVLKDEAILPKEEIQKNLDYIKQKNVVTVKEAEDVIDKIGVDEAYDLVVSDGELKPSVRTTVGQMLIKKFNTLAAKAPDKETKEYYWDKTIKTADFVSEKLGTEAGQGIQTFALFSELSPEAQLRGTIKEIKKQAQKKIEKRKPDVNDIGDKFKKANEETAEEITKEKEIKTRIENAEKSLSERAQEKIKRARARREKIIAKYKSEKRTNLYSGVGLTKEGIEYVGELAKTYIDEGIANLEIIADKIKDHLVATTNKDVDENVYKSINEVVSKKLNQEDLKTIGGVKDLKIGQIVKEHYTVVEKTKSDLVKRLVEESGLEKEEAQQLATKIQDAFDRVATRKKQDILAREAAKFNRIKKDLDGAKKVDKKTLQAEIIKFSNLGAFDNDGLLAMLGERLGTGQLTPEQGREIQRLAEQVQTAPEGSPKADATQDLLKYRANLKGNSWAEITQGVWYANVLSGYMTHIRNIVSTFFNGTAFVAGELARDPKSLPILLYGGARGFKRGGIEAWHTLTTGRSPIHVSKIETPQVLERIKFKGGLLNPVNYLKYVNRLMVAEDVIQFQGLKEMRATQLAYREAKRLGYKNPFSKAVWKYVNENLLNTKERYEVASEQATSEGLKGNEAQRRIYEIMEQSRPIEMQDDAYGFAAKGTFNHDTEGTLGALSDSVSRFLDTSLQVGGAKPLRFLVPFTRIITNVANNSLDFSPIGLVRGARGERGMFASEFSGKRTIMNKEERQQELIKGALGTASMLALYGLSHSGVIQISGAGPSDYRKRLQLQQEGWQPFSIKIGKTYYSYKLTPMVFAWGIVGSIRDHEQYDKDSDEQGLVERSTLALWDGARLISDMTWINSAAPIMSAISESNPGAAGTMLSNTATGIGKGFVLPSAYTQSAEKIEQIFNVPQKQTSGLFQSLITNVPIARNRFNDKINALGEPIVKDVDLLTSKENIDPVWKFLLDKKGWVAPVNRNTLILFDTNTKEDRPATDDEYYEFSKIRGAKIKEEIKKIMKEGAYVKGKEGYQFKKAEDLTSAELNKVLTPIKTSATKEAKNELLIKSYNKKK